MHSEVRLDDFLGGGPVVEHQEGDLKGSFVGNGGTFFDGDAFGLLYQNNTFWVEDEVLGGSFDETHGFEDFFDVDILRGELSLSQLYFYHCFVLSSLVVCLFFNLRFCLM